MSSPSGLAAPAARVAPRSGQQIRTVQALRALAALLVVAFHATVLWHDRFDARVVPWLNGNAGVDLFFAISGFIMLVSSRRLWPRPDGARRFLELRLIRVVPLYWLTTAAKLAAIAAVPALALHTRPTGWNILASFLFLPSRDAAGIVRPVLDVGWTLSFEMLFYLAFATAMRLRRDPLLVVGPAMGVLALASFAVRPAMPAIATLADPIVLEFVFGLAVGRLLTRQGRPGIGQAGLLVLGLVCLAVLPMHSRWERVAFWGVPAALALYAAVRSEPWLGPRLPRLAVGIGEASYSLYLTHGFVLPVIGVVVARAGLAGPLTGPVLIVSSLGLSTVAALLVYRFVEAPVTAWLRRVAHDRGRTVLAAPETPI